MMNQKGNLILIILVAFVVIALIPVFFVRFFTIGRLLTQVIMIFVIYAMVRGYLGPGPLSLLISVILIYFLVFKYIEVTASAYVLMTLVGVGFGSVVIWGLAQVARPK